MTKSTDQAAREAVQQAINYLLKAMFLTGSDSQESTDDPGSLLIDAIDRAQHALVYIPKEQSNG